MRGRRAMVCGQGRAFFLGTAGAAALTVAGGLFAFRNVFLELWVIHFELLADRSESRQQAAIRWLGDRRSVLAAPYLLEVAGRPELREHWGSIDELRLPIGEEAELALRKIPLGEEWYQARTLRGSEGARRLAIRFLGDLGIKGTVPHLEALAAADDGPAGLEAARSIARILGLEVKSVAGDPALPGKVVQLRLTNRASRSIWFWGNSTGIPRYLILQTEGLADPRMVGLREWELAPRSSKVFEVRLQESRLPFRIGIMLSVPERNREKVPIWFRVWSQEILPDRSPAPEHGPQVPPRGPPGGKAKGKEAAVRRPDKIFVMASVKGRILALGTAGAAVLLAAGGLIALRGPLLELWTIHFELLPEEGRQRAVAEGEMDRVESRQRGAIRWLGARRSRLAAPYLLEIAGRRELRELRDGELSIEEEAERALRQLPLGYEWYLARSRTGSEGTRCLAIRVLGDLGGEGTVSYLEALAAKDEGPAGLEAARSVARIRGLELEGMDDSSAFPKRIARLRLTNHAARPIWFPGYSLEAPMFWSQEKGAGAWVDWVVRDRHRRSAARPTCLDHLRGPAAGIEEPAPDLPFPQHPGAQPDQGADPGRAPPHRRLQPRDRPARPRHSALIGAAAEKPGDRP